MSKFTIESSRGLRFLVLRPGSSRLMTRGTWVGIALAIVIQSSMFIGMSAAKDIETGDTSSYFRNALEWGAEFRGNPLWSPLYTFLAGQTFAVTGDLQVTSLLLRVTAVLVSTVAVFLILHRFLALPLAVLLVTLWAANPAYYDSLYAVHLWALPLALIALVVLAYLPGPRGVAIALLLLALNAVFMRNEYFLVLVLFIGVLMIRAGRQVFKEFAREVREHWRLFGVLITLFVIILAGLGLRSSIPIGSEEFKSASSAKHTLNVCQIYAYYLQQVGDPRVTDPWSGCVGVMREDFGAETPSMTQAFVANPSAMAGMLVHNVQLLPNGMQILVTGAFGGGYSPDYWPQRQAPWAPWLTMLMFLLAAMGALTVLSKRARDSLPGRPDLNAAFFALLASTFVTGAFVAITQRPRPSYLYLMAAAIFVLSGLGITWLARRSQLGGLIVVTVLGVWCATRLLVGGVYADDYVNLFTGPGQPELAIYKALIPSAPDPLSGPMQIVITSPIDPGGLCQFLSRWEDACTPIVGEPATIVVSALP